MQRPLANPCSCVAAPAMLVLMFSSHALAQATAAGCQGGGGGVARAECDCKSRGGQYMGNGTTCGTVSSNGIVFGACCIATLPNYSGCVVTTAAACSAMAPSQFV